MNLDNHTSRADSGFFKNSTVFHSNAHFPFFTGTAVRKSQPELLATCTPVDFNARAW
jgi:hypothetical protein